MSLSTDSIYFPHTEDWWSEEYDCELVNVVDFASLLYDGNDNLFLNIDCAPQLVPKSISLLQANAIHKKIFIIDCVDATAKEFICQRFYSVQQWPEYILKKLMSEYLEEADMLPIVNFIIGNNGSFEVINLFIKIYNPDLYTYKLIKRIKSMYSYVEKNHQIISHHVHSNYYFYSITHKHLQYFNKDIRIGGLRTPPTL